MAGKPPSPPKSPPATPKRAAKPRRLANLPEGRWLGDFDPLSKVERQLIDHCARGAVLALANERPEKPTPDNTIRAGIVRFLLLGGDDQNPVHEQGVMIQGAWIGNDLNLRHALCRVRLVAHACRFEDKITAIEARIPALHLAGSSSPGLTADGIRVEGDVFLSEDFTATGEVRMLGAEIGGNLECSGSTFCNEEGDALRADYVKVKGGVFLTAGFTATGEVAMIGAEVGGDLDCTGAILSNSGGYALNADRIRVKGGVFLATGFTATGQVRILGAEIGGNLDCTGGRFTNKNRKALNLDGVNVRNALFVRGATFAGEIDLTAASAGTLADDRTCYKGAKILVHGFRYDRIVGPTGASDRIDWLKHQREAHLGADFRPLPWEQLIRVLRDMGHPAEAAEIAMEKQRLLRRARKIGRRNINPRFSLPTSWLNAIWVWLANTVARALHVLYGWIAGYGHRPSRIVIWMFITCALCSLAYYSGRDQGLIGPSAPVIQLHQRTAACGTGGDLGAIYWT